MAVKSNAEPLCQQLGLKPIGNMRINLGVNYFANHLT